MPSPLLLFPDRVAWLPPMLFAPADYYALMSAYPEVVVDTGMRYDKRFKQAHRYKIADTRGELTLTVPHSSPGAERTWDVTPVSSHGRWWDVHRVALESAYGRTPFFEFYIDRFLPLLAEPDAEMTVGRLIRRADELVRSIVCPHVKAVYVAAPGGIAADYRHIAFPTAAQETYYQVRSGALGFIGGLSVLDLIFNMGPESPLILRKISKKIPFLS